MGVTELEATKIFELIYELDNKSKHRSRFQLSYTALICGLMTVMMIKDG
jgi:hypothetical protein